MRTSREEASMSKHLSRLVLLAALLPLYAAAQERAAPEQPAHRHLGFFIRPELGFGGFASAASQDGVDYSISGGGGAFALAIGGAVSEDFIVGGQVWDVIASKPDWTIKSGGTEVKGTSSSDAGLVGYGVLLNWYLQPSNVYLAVTPSLTRLVSTQGTTTTTSDWGFGIRGAVGKEWWVADHWGIGVAASIGLSSNKDGGSGAPTWGSAAFAVTCSATYN